jgi:hypothetical protein
MSRLTRRQFIKAAALSGLLAGCRPAAQWVTPTGLKATGSPSSSSTPAPTDTRTAASVATAPTQTPVLPTAIPRAIRRPDIIKMYPTVKSKVIRTLHAGAWDGERLVPKVLSQMLDASLTKLTGLNDAQAAWAALFAPHERIAIKVNSLVTGASHVSLAVAVTERLQAAGVPAEQIFIYDRYTQELQHADYPVNREGSGVRCYGTDDSGPDTRRALGANDHYVTGWQILNSPIGLSEILANCDALINIPILKTAPEMGISCAMKNHFGTLGNPMIFHAAFEYAVSELNALPPIKDRTRLIIGDALATSTRGDGYGYEVVSIGKAALLVSFDPVAHDATGLQMARDALSAKGDNPEAITTLASEWLATGAELKVGTNDPERIELAEVDLT